MRIRLDPTMMPEVVCSPASGGPVYTIDSITLALRYKTLLAAVLAPLATATGSSARPRG